MNKQVDFIDLGTIDYKKCWKHQDILFSEILQTKSKNRKEDLTLPTKNHFIFCEHNHVYTIGKSGDQNNLLVSQNYLRSKKAEYYVTNRGGDITYHGPGQIVGYPILDLGNFFSDINRYLRLLEEVIILTLNDYGVLGERSKGETGVWINVGRGKSRKICAIGVKTSRWVTMHGFAFNVNTDLSYFDNIIPCGISNKGVTSLKKEINKTLCMNEVKTKIKNHFINLFKITEK
jgi:lipoyl(octanoyl) transferase|tara:strand:+ start:12515 stop:13210 length:696 start_codon:yes stop_codon:yes gene_type:complete